jgi:4-amino-4-deoxy-L-arabinose transferase-like glycosyltransferase
MDKKKLPFLILVIFFGLFLFQTIANITSIPFADYDEAHRAEGARNMRQEGFYLFPLVGSPYYQQSSFSLPYSLDQTKTLYGQTSRPPLVFNLMAVSSGFFGDVEWAYRLPSLIFGIASFGAIIIAAYFLAKKKSNFFALAVALLAAFTSYDWWLSSQMAHLDTAVSLFTALAVFLLIIFAQEKNKIFLFLSGLFLALAILSKGQPAVIFLFPLVYLFFTRKINFKEALLLGLTAFLVLFPWIAAFDATLGFGSWFKTYFGGYLSAPSATKIGGGDPTQAAPIFWYLRWWFDTLRPGVFLFGAFFLLDLIQKRLSWQKTALLFYIFGGFGFFSYAKSKVWWYVLPVLPALAVYLYLAIADYLKERKNGLVNLSLALIVASLPLFLWQTNTISLVYGLITTLIVFLILKLPLANYLSRITSYRFPVASYVLHITNYFLFPLSFLLGLTFFFFRFPAPQPIHSETKDVGQFFQSLPYPKCLWAEEDFPYEAILYYSRVGELDYFGEDKSLKSDCQNYLVASKPLEGQEIIYQNGPVRLYQLSGAQ